MQQTVRFFLIDAAGAEWDITVFRSEAKRLQAYLQTRLLEDGQTVSLSRAIDLLASVRVSRTLATKMWRGFICSGVFQSECDDCGVQNTYCPHYRTVTLEATDIIHQMDEFVRGHGDVMGVGPKIIDAALMLSEALRREVGVR